MHRGKRHLHPVRRGQIKRNRRVRQPVQGSHRRLSKPNRRRRNPQRRRNLQRQHQPQKGLHPVLVPQSKPVEPVRLAVPGHRRKPVRKRRRQRNPARSPRLLHRGVLLLHQLGPLLPGKHHGPIGGSRSGRTVHQPQQVPQRVQRADALRGRPHRPGSGLHVHLRPGGGVQRSARNPPERKHSQVGVCAECGAAGLAERVCPGERVLDRAGGRSRRDAHRGAAQEEELFGRVL